jgi:16S rRNA (cytosine1402-N4)-methyltransferase
MVAEVLGALRPHPHGRYVDATVGGGAHAEAILLASAPHGWLLGCDRDEDAIEAARQRLVRFAGRVEFKRGNFDQLAEWIEAESCDGVLFDLGASSPQFDRAERGFSFQSDGPLDMRMDRRQSLTAARLVNEASSEELAAIFWELGGEHASRRVARVIERERELRPFESTRQLSGLIERLLPRHGRKSHPATRVFQALRLAVNDEIGSLRRGLAAAWKVLKPGGRLAVITFHSLEDRVVKEFGREGAKDYTVVGEVDRPEFRTPRAAKLNWIQRKATKPSPAEVAANPRARSAQLRVFEKL